MSGQSRNISEEFKWSGNQNSNRFQLAPGTVVEFAGRKEGRRIITTRDDYFRRLSTFDKSARMLAVSGISETGYRKFLAKCVIDWNEEEKQKIIPILEVFSKEVASHYLPFPCKVPLVRTSGEEEIHAAYTRANAIFLPHYFVNDAEPQILAEVIRHEFFHVLTRANPNLRDKLYKIIGFERSGEVKFPQPLRGRIITNPDAPVNDHCIKVGYKGDKVRAMPVLFADDDFDPAEKKSLFDYLCFRLLLVEPSDSSPGLVPVYRNGSPVLVEAHETDGFYEQIGHNTKYIWHPEEILADNFVQLVMGSEELPSPFVVQRMAETFRQNNQPASLPAEPVMAV